MSMKAKGRTSVATGHIASDAPAEWLVRVTVLPPSSRAAVGPVGPSEHLARP
jgi:hypothetical protein